MSTSVRPRLALLADYVEEGWLAMQQTAEHFARHWRGPLQADLIVPQYRRLAAALPVLKHSRRAFNADRFVNRLWRYPRDVRSLRGRYDLFLVVDHSYAQLVHQLPRGRTGVYCHDLDAFRSILEPDRERRPWWFRAMARHQLRGLERADVIFTNSRQTEGELLHHGIADARRIIYAPLGISAEYTLNRPPQTQPPKVLERLAARPWMLHVGSCVPRKRVDVLLRVFAAARRRVPDLMLLKVSGQFSPAHQSLIEDLGLRDALVHLHDVPHADLAELYRMATVVVVTSEAEGFGLPAAEATACGGRLIASDLPALREAGGTTARYCPVADLHAWTEAVVDAIEHPERWPPPEERARSSQRYTWELCVQTVAAAMESLLIRGAPR